MAEFKLGRIRFVWKGDWVASTTYYQDDVVQYGGKIYICVIGHNSQADFFDDFDITPPNWNLVSEGQTWKGDWTTTTRYIPGDIVKNGARLYIATTDHISGATLDADIANWDVFAEGLQWKGTWTTGTDYAINDIVKYGGTTYICNTAHTSAATDALGLEADQSSWEYFNQGIEFKSIWSPGVRYKVNDVVRYGATLWIVTTEHTSSDDFATDTANWEKFVEGFQYEGEWSPYVEYQPGDIVQYGGYQYIAKTNHSGTTPTADANVWDQFSEGFKYLGEWGEDSTGKEYRVGEIVAQGGFTYICILDHANQQPPNVTYWKRFTTGLQWRGEWLDDQEYFEGDVVRFGDNSYVCVKGHISEGDDYSSGSSGAEGSRPDLADSGQYWSVFAVGSEESVLTTKGDLVYYSGTAPTRLPIGLDGQVLTVSGDGIPNWEYIGGSEDVYYVAEGGKNEPAPIYGKTIDRPFASIRYACQQIDRGTKNPQARELLELNRRFIQKEIVEWTASQIATNTSPFTSSFDFDTLKCERDMGLIVDALVWDITHGGNVRSREAALSYVENASAIYTLGQEAETVASINYGLEVIEAVLTQTNPDTNYQLANGDLSTVVISQYTDENLIAETGVLARATELTGIITDAITAGNDRNIPERIATTNLIKVSTGKYYEVLPIIVPAETCVMGDELRSTQVFPRTAENSTLTPTKDYKFSFAALERMEEIIGDVVDGYEINKSPGNTEAQTTTYPYALAPHVAPQAEKLSRTIRRRIDDALGQKIEAVYTPSYELADPDYGYARDLFLQNKEFIKAEVKAYLDDQFPDLLYSRTKCLEDVGHIMDAVAYDLTYGGTWLSIETGKAYFNGASGSLQIDSSEKAATLAAYAQLKSLLQTVGRNITVNPTYQEPAVVGDVSTVDVPQEAGTGGSLAVSTQIGTLMDIIIDIIDNGYASAPSVTYPTLDTTADSYAIKTAVDNVKATVQETTIDFISKNFGSFRYDSAVCRRDLTNILTDIAYDVALGTNYNQLFNGQAYNRPTNSYNLTNQRVETIGAIRQARDLLVTDYLTDSTAQTRAEAAFNEIVDLIQNGLSAADAYSYPVPAALPTGNADDAFDNLAANKTFIVAEITAWIEAQILEDNVTNPDPQSIWFGFTYNSAKCERDVEYIVEAMKYDILYGGTMATTRIAESYFGDDGTAYPANQSAQTAAAYDRLATVLDQIVREASVTASSGNGETQTQLGSPATSTEGNILLANMQIIEDVITAGNKTGLAAAVYPNLSTLNVGATLVSEKGEIDNSLTTLIPDVVQYISDTYNDFNYNHAKCSRDIGLIIDAALYDYALDSNFASLFAAQAYLRAPSAKVTGDQKTATLAANEFAKLAVIDEINSNGAHPKAVAGIENTWEWIDDLIFSGSGDGGNSQVEDQEVYNAIRTLELNKEFMVQEILSYADDYFKLGVSSTLGSGIDTLTVSDTRWLEPGQAVRFVDEDSLDSSSVVTLVGLQTEATYFVKDILSDTTLTVCSAIGGTQIALNTEASDFVFDHNKCRRDTGYIIDAAGYDLTLGTNYNSIVNARAYTRANAGLAVGEQREETIDGINFARDRIADLRDVRSDISVLNQVNSTFNLVTTTITDGISSLPSLSFPAPSTATTGEANAALQLQANRSFLQAEVIQWITDNYPALTYDQTKCERDVGYIVDALTYDILYGGNSATVDAAEAYFVGVESQLGSGQETATQLAYNYLQSIVGYVIEDDNDPGTWTPLQVGVSQDVSNGAGTATESSKAETLVGIIEQVIADGDLDSLPTVTYPDVSSASAAERTAQVAMENAKSKIIEKTIKYLDRTYAAFFYLEADYDYDRTLCARDVREYIDAVKYDMTWPRQWKREYTDNVSFWRPGCYKTRQAADWYVNAAIGSQEQNMYLMRNGTGLRLQTLNGLKGDLTAVNSAGTNRVTAGAYASLDPGWGPDDEKVWITSRSPYLQNNTCFGYAAIGQKIDGALHNGGNDSMVSNDFTQLISDGIGAWVTNNGRAELVSVFTYYSSVGYLAENGGRIRATNGNNSYGRIGSSAEGTDADETAVTAVVDNKSQYSATIPVVNTDNDTLQNIEYGHAGDDYTEAQYEIFGAGANEVIVADEFRDQGVNFVRITETVAGSAGGTGYLVVSNTAQTGSTSGLTLAATDGNLSTAYPGMRVQITGGAGIGLYGIIDTYNAGSKQATIVRDSDGAAGWDHIVPGTPFETPNSTSTYVIEPAATIAAPTNTSGPISLPTSTTWYDVKFVTTSDEYTGVASQTETDGNGATFDVVRNGSKYYVSLNNGGSEYKRLDTLTILGSALGGDNTTHDITITVTTINSATGAIVDFDFTGNGKAGQYLAVGAGTNGALSDDGSTWTAETLPSAGVGTWNSIATGLQDDGSSTYKVSAAVVVQDGDNNVAYSEDGDTWSTTTLPAGISSAGAKQAAFGQVVSSGVNRIVVISDDDVDVALSDDGGANWTLQSSALPATGYTSITYGKGLWVAVDSGSTNIQYSEDGVTWTAAGTVPGNVAGNVVWGNGRFVVIGGANGTMYSLDGDTWYDPEISTGVSLTLPLTVTERKIAYGQGIFVITSDDTDQVQWSQDGMKWNAYTLSGVSVTGGFNAIAFGNPEKQGKFVILPNNSGTGGAVARIGATAIARTAVSNEQIFEVRLLEPGSCYTSTPTITITDPNNINDVELTVQTGTGVLSQPTFVNRGSGFTTASGEINSANSNGSALFFQNGQFVAVRRLSARPVDGSNVEFDSLPGQYFKLVQTVSFSGTNEGSYKGFLQLSPDMSIADAPADGDPVELRIRFSQVRLTGHDFLDIGTGNFVDTNYPNEPVNDPDQTKETNDAGGGRVFFTATDQDGNFRVGNLFSVEQATGVATLDAEAFNIAGLQELSLGEVTLGGNSATINEFSTDPFFTANSDTIVPTQRAIKSYIEAQIGGGGASLVVNSVTAGDIFIGQNLITTVSGDPINIKGNINFTGTVLGLPLAYNYFLR